MTKTEAHTPGPWSIFGTLSGRQFDREGRTIGEKLPWFICADTEVNKICGFGLADYKHKSDQEIWANARLIALAPQLLAAVETALYCIDSLKTWLPKDYPASARLSIAEHESKFRALMAKAKGQAELK